MYVCAYICSYNFDLIRGILDFFSSSWIAPSNWLTWRPTSMAKLAQAERKILQGTFRIHMSHLFPL